MADLDLAAAVHAALTGDAALMAAVTGVHDAVPDGAAPPYVVLELEMVERSGGRRLFGLDVTVVSRYAGRREIVAIQALTAAVLDGRSFVLDGGSGIARLAAAPAVARDGGMRRGRQRFLIAIAAAPVLTIAGAALLAPYAGAGLRHRLTPIAGGALWRDVNGTARVTGGPDKYRLALAAETVAPPAFEGLARGQEVTVGAATALAVRLPAGSNAVVLARAPVAGSVTAETAAGAAHPVTEVDGATVTVADHPGFEVWVRYRPLLTMLVEDWSQGVEDWHDGVPWSLDLVER